MKIGVPKERKIHEYRVGLTPAGVRELSKRGHAVYIESGAGNGAGFIDQEYIDANGHIVSSAQEVFSLVDLLVKVKEPSIDECRMLQPGQIIFTYLHLAADPHQAEALCAAGAVAFAYETVSDSIGRLPLLAPMSEVAGRMAVQVGAHALEKANHGVGVLLSGVPGVPPAKVVILGAGVVGTNGARLATGLGAEVTILDTSLARLREIDSLYGSRIKTLYSTMDAISRVITTADLVIGSVLVTGASAPKIVSKDMLYTMKQGAVLVDVAIDQGGCFETSRPTSHADPMYLVDGIVHYCVTNMPGAVPRTSTLALTNATLPFVQAIADLGWRDAVIANAGLHTGLNIAGGSVVHPAVADSLHMPLTPVEKILGRGC